MIDLELISIPENATPSELRDVSLLLLEAIRELRSGFETLQNSLEDLSPAVEEEIVTLNRPVYLQELPDGERWIQISDKLWHYIEDNGSHSVKNMREYEQAKANEANTVTPTDTTEEQGEVTSKEQTETDGETSETAE